MKQFCLYLSFFAVSGLSAQETEKTKDLSNHKPSKIPEPIIVRGVDISKTNSNEQGFILYMESLSDEEALELLKSMIQGEIVYKKK